MSEFETDNQSGNTISIGKYNFLKKSFEWANEKILDGFNQKPEWMIIDEIGKLELMGEGLDKSIIDALRISAKHNTKLILVVRDYLLEKVISRYGLNEDKYLIVTDLNKI
jgi:nucleoside-triphosphatase THEP1